MKRLLLLLTAVLFIALSCKSDDHLQEVIDVINAEYEKDIQPGELKLEAQFTIGETLDSMFDKDKYESISEMKYSIANQIETDPSDFIDNFENKFYKAILKRINKLELQEPDEIDFSVYIHKYKGHDAVRLDYYFLGKNNEIIGIVDEETMNHFKYEVFTSSINPYKLVVLMVLGDENLYEIERAYHKEQALSID